MVMSIDLAFLLWLFHFAINPCLPTFCTFALYLLSCAPTARIKSSILKVSSTFLNVSVGGFSCSYCGFMAVGVPISFTVSLRGCYKAPERLQVSKNYSIDRTKARSFSLQRVKWVDDSQEKLHWNVGASEGAERTHSNIFDDNHKAAICSIISYILILCLIIWFVAKPPLFWPIWTFRPPTYLYWCHLHTSWHTLATTASTPASLLQWHVQSHSSNFPLLRQSIWDFQRWGKRGGKWITYCIDVP